MSNNLNRPKEDDAVLGGATPPPVGGAVLGGLEGIQQRLASERVEIRVAALKEALTYGEAGLDLVVRALQDESKPVRREAYLLLRNKTDDKVTEALRDYKTWNLVERFEGYKGYQGEYVAIFANRKVEEFDPQSGIADPVGTAYALRCEYDEGDEITDKLARLLQDPQASKLEALVIGPWISLMESGDDSSAIVQALVAAKEQLASLKALFLGDICSSDCEISWIAQSNISPVLEAYPNLEMLQIRGGEGLVFSQTRHENLEILAIETGGLSRETIANICALELPTLEHLELWLGSDDYGGDSSVEDLMPILSGDLFPSLTYLGLRNSQYSDKIAAALVDSPVLQQISVLDLSMGTLGNKGALALLESPAINQLDILNVADNYIADTIVERLERLDCQVMADDQEEYYEEGEEEDDDEDDRYCSVAE